jgi:hypothetical protein
MLVLFAHPQGAKIRCQARSVPELVWRESRRRNRTFGYLEMWRQRRDLTCLCFRGPSFRRWLLANGLLFFGCVTRRAVIVDGLRSTSIRVDSNAAEVMMEP